MISLSLISAQPAQRQAWRAVFAGDAEILVLDVCDTAEAAREALIARPPRVALFDLRSDRDEWLELIAEFAIARSATTILAAGAEAAEVFPALRAGAGGFLVHAETGAAEWCAAVREAHLGGAPLSRSAGRHVVGAFAREERRTAADRELSERERAVLGQLAAGATYRGAGENLGIAEDTVRAHIRGLYRKLHVNTREEAVAWHRVLASESSRPDGARMHASMRGGFTAEPLAAARRENITEPILAPDL